MPKAIFMDFYGTVAMEIGPIAVSVIKDVYKNSKAQSPEDILKHWCSSPLYDDAKEFLQSCSLPIYFVTNSDNQYIREEIKRYSLHPAGVITSEEAKYSKPRKEIFLYALKKADISPEEVIHVGDSLEGDVQCPSSVGIRSIWLNRESQPVPVGVENIDNLQDLQKYL